jgi:hypothetical protein
MVSRFLPFSTKVGCTGVSGISSLSKSIQTKKDKMKKLTIMILSAVLFTACTKNQDLAPINHEEAASPAALAFKGPREFRGQFEANPDPSSLPTACSGDLGLAIPGYVLHGNAQHLGELIWQQSWFQHVSCNLNAAAGQLTTSISGQFAAANGDLIYYTGNDVLDVSNFLAGNGQPGTIQGTWTITGGTGRFAGASGTLTISGLVNFATLTFSFEAVGTIAY